MWPDGTPRFKASKTRSPTPGCIAISTQATDVDICLSQLLTVAVGLSPKAGDDLPKCGTVPAGQPCLKVARAAIDAQDAVADKGLFYRIAVRGNLDFCRATPDPMALACTDPTKIINAAVMIPQLGRLRFLALKNGVVENSGLIANFAENGMPTDVSFVTSKAAGAAMAAAAANAGKKAKDFDDARRKERKEDQATKDAKSSADAATAKAEKDAADKQGIADAAAKKAEEVVAETMVRTANQKLADDAQAEADLANARLAVIVAAACLCAAEAAAGISATCPAQ